MSQADTYDYSNNSAMSQVKGFTTPHAVAGVVIGSLLVLCLIRRGFRGVSAGGITVGVK